MIVCQFHSVQFHKLAPPVLSEELSLSREQQASWPRGIMRRSAFGCFKTSQEIICLAANVRSCDAKVLRRHQLDRPLRAESDREDTKG